MSQFTDNYDEVRLFYAAGMVPTIPPSEYKSDGTWILTDLFDGQMCINRVDGKAWLRAGTEIVPFVLAGSLSQTDYIQFNTGYTTTTCTEGMLHWNQETHTLNVCLNDDVSIQVGQENVVPVKNNTGTLIPNGAVVYINGSDTEFPTISLADNRYELTSDQTLGIVTSNDGIAHTDTGFVCTDGLVHDLSFTYSAGTVVYLGEDGGITDVRVQAPLHNTLIGRVINSTTLLVTVQLGSQLRDQHDVIITDPVDGQTIIYDNGYFVNQVSYDKVTGFPNRTDSVLDWNNSAHTLTITPSDEFYYIYNQGRRFTITEPKSIQIDSGTSQINYIYFDEDGVLQNSPGTFPDIYTSTLASFVSWNSVLQDGIAFEERHGTVMDTNTHLELHEKIGTYVVSGFGISGYTLNTTTDVANRYSIATGMIADEDIRFMQEPLTGTGDYCVWYKTGSTGTWLYTSDKVDPFFFTTGSYIHKNNYNGTIWTTTALGNSEFINYYVFVTNAFTNSGKQYLIVPGQVSYATKALAVAANISELDMTGLPIVEFASLYRITYQTSASYGTVGKVRTTQVDRVVSANLTIQAGSFLNNHSVLSNLGTDDHKQYKLILGDTLDLTPTYSGEVISSIVSIDTRGTANITINRDVNSRISSVVSVKNGVTKTTTITRDVNGKITSVIKA